MTQAPPEAESDGPHLPDRDGQVAVWLSSLAGLLALAALAFGRNLGDTFLSDDYVYVDTARRGLAALLRGLTVASYPQVIRPVPALLWMLASLGRGHVVLHALSAMLHAANGRLLALLPAAPVRACV
jgi:hypothetical protein